MANASALGRNPKVFTATGQTVPGGLKLSWVTWDWNGTTRPGTCILRDGGAASPNYILTLRALAGVADTITATVGHWYRDVNTVTLTAGTLYAYSSPHS